MAQRGLPADSCLIPFRLCITETWWHVTRCYVIAGTLLYDGMYVYTHAAGNTALVKSPAGTPGKQAHFTRASAAGDGLGGARVGVRLQVRLVLGVHARKEVVSRGAAASVCAAAAVPQADAHPREACNQMHSQRTR